MHITLKDTGQQLYRLSSLNDYEVHSNDPDPRGYTFRLTSGDHLGLISGLYADPRTERVTYFEITLDDIFYTQDQLRPRGARGRVILVPAEMVRTDVLARNVYVQDLTEEGLHQFAPLSLD